MSKCLTVVAFALLVLSGAMGLRNIVATHAASSSGTSLSAKSGLPFPPPLPRGGGQ
jgi:hypothetical protein